MADPQSMTAQLSDRPTSIGTFFKSKSPTLAEALGASPLDFLVVDRQHTSVDLETVESIVRAADAGGLRVMVRLATTEFDFVNCFLDAGAHALMIPQVESPAAVRNVLAETQYEDDRSLSMGTRAGEFGARDREAYFEWVREELGIVPQIETEAGLETVDAIADAERVTALMIGPTDLSLSLGVSKTDPELDAAIDRIVEAARAADVGVGTFATAAADVRAYREEMDFVIYGSDAGLIGSAVEGALDG
ncbi:HpcH/HpaI aldolase family protein [Halovivax limisalsi]|uniref:HpcH/HpaI aldolase family protein n=1 Tax=Halovivax limisalsi TaxID=1453760 RepID=UPI001FFCE6F9|nr:aldolase/citrate lyase family protein [Halovivax limisalsi]